MFPVVSWLWIFALTINVGPKERDLYAPRKANIAFSQSLLITILVFVEYVNQFSYIITLLGIYM